MQYYVEYLRAMRCLRIVGIILGVFLLIGIIFRLSFLNHGSPEMYINDLRNSPTAHVTQTRLADGSTRTVIVDPARRTHAVIIRQGRNFRMDVTEPVSNMRAHEDDMVSLGSSMNENTVNGMSHVTIAYTPGGSLTWSAFFLISVLIGLVSATCLAAPLAKENDGHLEMAWTKPVSRERYALQAFAVDGVAIVVSQLACIAVALICILMWTVPQIALGQRGWMLILLSLLVPFAWYACLTAFSASIKRGPGMVIGLGWFAALIIPSIMGATAEIHRSAVAQWIHAITKGLSYLNPIVYLPSMGNRGGIHGNLFDSIEASVIALIILTVVYIAVAVLQWRRVEA